MGFKVETVKFEGPLDLMLHLIHDKQLDIFDLDMLTLTDQYIEYLNSMTDLKLEVESEYLVELATLIEYKSKKLLPNKSEEIEDELADTKDRLVQRLLEYQKYKEVAKVLNEQYMQRLDQRSKPTSFDEYESIKEDNIIEGDPNDLLKAMNRVLRRVQLTRPLDIKYTQKELSPEERILQIRSRMKDLPKTFDFDTLISDCDNLKEYVVTFIAILDMAKNHYLTFSVDSSQRIWFRKGNDYE